MASRDRGAPMGKLGTSTVDMYECHGCYEWFHWEYRDARNEIDGWRRDMLDVYPMLIAWGVILGVFWIISGIAGFISHTKCCLGKIVIRCSFQMNYYSLAF